MSSGGDDKTTCFNAHPYNQHSFLSLPVFTSKTSGLAARKQLIVEGTKL
jgi:hypothetical protein